MYFVIATLFIVAVVSVISDYLENKEDKNEN